MGECAEAILTGVYCEGCGEFLNAEADGQPQKCESCFENELIDAVENNNWPDGLTFSVWENVKQKYSEPEHAFRE